MSPLRYTLVAAATASAISAAAQYAGGRGDGFDGLRVVALDPSGATRNLRPVYAGGRGDGFDDALATGLGLGGASVAVVFASGRGDGHDARLLVAGDLAGTASLATVYGGGRGDGFDAAAVPAGALDGSATLAVLFGGGTGDGFDVDAEFQRSLGGGSLAGLFAGGRGDGFDVEGVEASAIDGTEALAALFGGGTGDGFDRSSCSGAPPLPLSLIALEAFASGAVTVIRWSTADEHGTDFFVVERSVDAATFAGLGEVDARGEGASASVAVEYAFTDAAPPAGTSYYRLAVNDRDGSRAYTDLVAVTRDMLAEEAAWSFGLYPNPSSGDEVYVAPRGLVPAAPLLVEILDEVGRRVFASTFRAPAGGEALRIGLAERLRPGAYVVRLTASGESRTKVVVVGGA